MKGNGKMEKEKEGNGKEKGKEKEKGRVERRELTKSWTHGRTNGHKGDFIL